MARAAITKSRPAKERLDARTTRNIRGMVPIPMIKVSFQTDTPQKATIAMTATIAGKARITKEPALSATSRRPPL